MLPAHVVPRITAQHGCFTIHGRKIETLESFFKKSKKNRIAKIIIDDNEAINIKTDLAISGVIETSLFPDLDGLSRHLRWNTGMDGSRQVRQFSRYILTVS